MKLNIISKENKANGNIALPAQFNEPVRADIIKKAVLAIQANSRQQYGASKEAGKRYSVRISKRRHDYRGTYGIGQSRTPRKVISYRGSRFNWVGAFAPQTVGGRRAHPAKGDKSWVQKLNTNERLKAIRSAMSATLDKELVAAHGYNAPESYPFVLGKEFESIEKTKDLVTALSALGFDNELERTQGRKIRAGKGKMRGRKYKNKTSALFVVADDCALTKSASNLPGVDVVVASQLNAELLAPGAIPGRLTLFSEQAIEKISKEELFVQKEKKTTKKEAEKSAAKKKTSAADTKGKQ